MKRPLPLLICLLLLLLGAALWLYGTDSGRAWRLARTPTRDLLARTLANPKDRIAQRILGERLLSDGRAEEAVTTFRAASEAEPEAAWPLAALGRALVRAGHPADAVAPLERALRLSPRDADAHAALGEAYTMLDQREAAETHFRAAIAADAAHAEALAGLAILETDKRNDAEARELARRAAEAAPNSCAAWTALGYVEDKAGNTTKSLAALSRAVTAAPNDARAWRLLAAARVRSARTPEEFARAEEALARAERLTPALPMIPYQRGLLRAREGRHSEAIGEFQRALERNPNFTDALYNLSLSLAFAGRAEESAQARKRFERASDYQRDRTALQLRLSADPENLALWRRLAQRAEAQQDIATADLARRHILALESARQRAAP